MIRARSRLKVKQSDETLERFTNMMATKLFKSLYDDINHEADVTWRSQPTRYVEGKIALWTKIKAKFDETMDTEVLYMKQQQSKKINSFCVKCGIYKCFEHCNFGDCGADITFYRNGEYLMSDYDDYKHYPANSDGTPHLLCTLRKELPYNEYHMRVVQEERKLKLRWRRDPNK